MVVSVSTLTAEASMVTVWVPISDFLSLSGTSQVAVQTVLPSELVDW